MKGETNPNPVLLNWRAGGTAPASKDARWSERGGMGNGFTTAGAPMASAERDNLHAALAASRWIS